MEIITKYEIKTDSAECKGHIKEYYPGYGHDNNIVTEAEIVESYDKKEDALNALCEYDCSAHEFNSSSGTMLKIKEYWVEENSYDAADGKWYSGGDIIAFARPSDLTRAKMSDKVSDAILNIIDKNVDVIALAYKTDWYEVDRPIVCSIPKEASFIVMIRDTGVDTVLLNSMKSSYSNIRRAQDWIKLNSTKRYLYYNGQSLSVIPKNVAETLCNKAFSELPSDYVKAEESKKLNQKSSTVGEWLLPQLEEYLKEHGFDVEPRSPQNTQSR